MRPDPHKQKAAAIYQKKQQAKGNVPIGKSVFIFAKVHHFDYA